MDNVKTTNRLINEKSPYLLQHAHNPVDWYPWGYEAFNKATAEDKLIFLSIGYSTCHWCHVMERESFEDNEVADILNRFFVSIKVDREERPDIDAVYMSVCQALIGSGGWPLTVIMTPERKPIFAGTYFPKNSKYGATGLIAILDAIHKNWMTDRQKLIESAEEITLAFRRFNPAGNNNEGASHKTIIRAAQDFSQSFDDKYGGFGIAPKFPTPHNLMFLMRYYVFENEKPALDITEKTLVQMYRGGIFDHIGGGFSRYSTDMKWLVPHFEKMLYDNALLTIAYLEAYKLTGTKLYLRVAERTLNYIKKEMTAPEGGFYSAQDADSEGIEGKYYLFSPEETKSILGINDGEYFNGFYDITEKGNFEGLNIPNLIENKEFDKWNERLESITDILYTKRLTRYSLIKDDKILTSWNCLMITALSNAYMATENNEYLTRAQNAMKFITQNLTDSTNKNLKVRYRERESIGNGFLDDYAFFIWALLSLYDSTYDVEYLKNAVYYCRKMIDLFYDNKNSGFYLYSNDSEHLIYRPKETYDSAMPSGNSVAGYVLYRLTAVTEARDIEDVAYRQGVFLENAASQYPSGFTFTHIAQMQILYDSAKLICVLPNNDDIDFIKHELGKRFLPNLTVLIKTPENSDALSDIAEYTRDYTINNDNSVFYLCKNKTCYPPEHDFNKILEKLNLNSMAQDNKT